MTGDRDHVQVIAQIYDAVADPACWGQALKAAGEMLEAPGMVLVYGDPTNGNTQIIASSGFTDELVEAYNLEHIRNDELVQESLSRPVGMTVSSSEVFPKDIFLRTGLYRLLLQPNELFHVAGAAFLKDSTIFAALWMARPENMPDFTEEDYCSLNELFPHLERAIGVHHRVLQAEQLAEFAAGAFDRVAVGVVLTDARGRPLLVNREARRMGDERDGFFLLDDGPAAHGHDDTKMLRDLIRESGGDDFSAGRTAGGGIRLSRPSGRADYQAIVLPLPRRCQPVGADGAVAVLFVMDPEKSQASVDHLVRDIYGLTSAEVRLVMQLLTGSSLTDAAEKLGLSRNTVHSQLASVFRKTGTGRQSELIKLVLKGPATVRGPDDSSGFFSTIKQ